MRSVCGRSTKSLAVTEWSAVDPSIVLAAYNGLKFAKDSISTLIQGKVEIEAQARISVALTKLGDAQDALFQLRDELFTMQAEIARLKSDIDRTNNWKDRLSSYELVKTAGGAVVY
jgi:cob(I)alamin adenosyltransferase